MKRTTTTYHRCYWLASTIDDLWQIQVSLVLDKQCLNNESWPFNVKMRVVEVWWPKTENIKLWDEGNDKVRTNIVLSTETYGVKSGILIVLSFSLSLNFCRKKKNSVTDVLSNTGVSHSCTVCFVAYLPNILSPEVNFLCSFPYKITRNVITTRYVALDVDRKADELTRIRDSFDWNNTTISPGWPI